MAQRRQWPAAKWKSWYANIQERERLNADAVQKMKSAATRKDAEKSSFAQLKKMTVEAIEQLEKCKAMCGPDDPEDVRAIERELEDATRQQYHFSKSSTLDIRH